MKDGEDKKILSNEYINADQKEALIREYAALRNEKEQDKLSVQGKFTQPAANQMQFGAYAGQAVQSVNVKNPGLSQEVWDKEKKAFEDKPWNSTPQGRFAIRCFTRGVLGCLFYAAGNRIASNALRTYHPERNAEGFVQHIAKFFDTVAGKPIRFAVNAMGGDGHAAVTFNPTVIYYPGTQGGCSLGHRMVAVTFDFATMSVGDAMGRDIVGMFDPNVKKTWMKDGRIDYPEAVRTMAMNTFRYLTYNQGEDWAVALPYVYFIKAQRGLINKFSPGFAYDSDRSLNGGSFKVDGTGRAVGNYQLEGLLDLQTRFSIYNVGTLMFREAYMEAADRFFTWQEKGCNPLELPEHYDKQHHKKPLLENAKDTIGDLTKWAARDLIKGFIYMTPSVPFFWISRTPQSKHNGLFINPEQGMMTTADGQNHTALQAEALTNAGMNRGAFNAQTPTYFSQYNHDSRNWARTPMANNPMVHGPFNPYAQSFGATDAILNSVGRANNNFRLSSHAPVDAINNRLNTNLEASIGANRFMDAWSKAALAYTPYFWAKTEFAKKWDNGRMDEAIERFLHGVATLDIKESKEGINEISDVIQQRPLRDPAREAIAKKRIADDISPADVFDPQIGKLGHRGCPNNYREQMKTRKEAAQQKLDNLKAKSAMTFSEQVIAERNLQKDDKNTLRDDPIASQNGYVAYENQRIHRDEFAPLGTTIH